MNVKSLNTVKTTFLFLLMTGIAALAQTAVPPPAVSGDTNNTTELRRALRNAIADQTNAAPTEAKTVPSPAQAIPPIAVPADTNVETAVETPATAQNQVVPETVPAEAPPVAAAIPQISALPAPTEPAAPITQEEPEELLPAGVLDFAAADLDQVLTLYAEWVNRTILMAPNLAAPTITIHSQTPLTRKEAIQALDAVLALNGIALINMGDKFVKAVPVAQATQEGQKPSTLGASELPDLGQFVTEIVQLKTAKPSELAPILQEFSKTKNVLAVDSSQILVIRDYTENVKRMLELIHQIDVSTPAEFVSEVIPIKYALAADIANALNSLSGSSSGTTVGSSTSGRLGVSSFRGGIPQPNQPRGVTTPAGTPSSTSPFSQRLQSIIRRAASPTGGDVQVLGETKIIADERTNSLLIFATRQDMAMIKDIISKLDVVLAQVLIESIIMEVSLDDSQNVGISYLQHPKQVGQFSGVGALKTTPFLTPAGFVLSGLTNNANGLPSGFNYFATFGDTLDVTLQAIAENGRVNILSRPRIQTSHAVPAQLFIGNTVPYITGTTYGDFTGATSRSVYQEKQVGITLDVLPLINPDGLVVMDIQQDIEQLGTPTTIDGNPVPTTVKRSASAKVAVKDGETVILGGFIATSKTSNKSGVPFLKDIPLLGYLFRSTGESSKRVELIVLLRPTVLPTPEIAAQVATNEKHLLPGVRRAEAEINAEDAKAIRKADMEGIGVKP